MIIDAHSHAVHGQYLDQLAAAGGEWAKRIIAGLWKSAQKKPHYLDVALRLEQLDRNDIALQVVTPGNVLDANLFPGDTEGQLAVARAINDNMARLMEDSKGRLLPAATLPLTGLEPQGRRELERAIKTLGLKAVNLPSNINGKPVDLPEYEPFWAQVAGMGIPVYIHPRDPAGHGDRRYEAEYDLTHNFGWPFETTLTLSRLVFSGVMERYPNLKVVSHHLGGMIPFFWGRTLETYETSGQPGKIGRVLPRPLFDYFSRFYYDTAVGGSAAAIRCACDVFGPGQIVFATDSPWGPGTGEDRMATYADVIRSLGLSDADNKMIFEDNARKILNLPT